MICLCILTYNVYGFRLLSKVICTYVLFLGPVFTTYVFHSLHLYLFSAVEHVLHDKAL